MRDRKKWGKGTGHRVDLRSRQSLYEERKSSDREVDTVSEVPISGSSLNLGRRFTKPGFPEQSWISVTLSCYIFSSLK